VQPCPPVVQRWRPRRPGAVGEVWAVALFGCIGAGSALAQAIAPTPAAPVGVPVPAATPARSLAAPEEGVRWQKLKPAQREDLKPLQPEWSKIDSPHKQKWLQLADRMPGMPADERVRVQGRMAQWATLSPAERGQARLRYQEARQVAPLDRRSRWEDYQALSPEQKSALAARAASAASPNAHDNSARRAVADNGRPDRGDKIAHDASRAKSNIVPNPAFAAPPRPIAPTVLQAAPGATTTLITRRPAPPPHQQTGLPKIAATPEFVNRSTLQPQRGPQGAAVRSATPSESASSGRR
jgi:hypothetical protein